MRGEDKIHAQRVHDFKIVLEFDYPAMGYEEDEPVEERAREALDHFLRELRQGAVWPVRASVELRAIEDEPVPHHQPLVVEVGDPNDY